MNRMEKPNKTYVSKPRKRLGIFCLIMDAVYVILGLSFYQYNNLPSLYQHILSRRSSAFLRARNTSSSAAACLKR